MIAFRRHRKRRQRKTVKSSSELRPRRFAGTEFMQITAISSERFFFLPSAPEARANMWSYEPFTHVPHSRFPYTSCGVCVGGPNANEEEIEEEEFEETFIRRFCVRMTPVVNLEQRSWFPGCHAVAERSMIPCQDFSAALLASPKPGSA